VLDVKHVNYYVVPFKNAIDTITMCNTYLLYKIPETQVKTHGFEDGLLIPAK
jgi:hypothetical protein